jgi:hypothetical protein
VIVDDFIRYTWVFFLSDKSDTFATFKYFVKRCHNELEVTMEVSLETLELMSFVMNLESNIHSQPNTHLNQMALLRERIEHSLIWQGLCLVSIM